LKPLTIAPTTYSVLALFFKCSNSATDAAHGSSILLCRCGSKGNPRISMETQSNEGPYEKEILTSAPRLVESPSET